MNYYLYKITNEVNNKVYIGVHKTSNIEDGYMGSGVLLSRAKKKYGIENFTKEILQFFETEEDMWNEEAAIVTESFISSDLNYNARPGGQGGWSREDQIKGGQAAGAIRRIQSREGLFNQENNSQYGTCWITNGIVSKKIKKTEKIPEGWRLGRVQSNRGKNHQSVGKKWANNGEINKRLLHLPEGWQWGMLKR